MNKFTLELLFRIIGIGSASGLIYKDNTLLLIGDNSAFLYEYDIASTELKRHPLIDNPSDNIPKKLKPDFEALAEDENNYYVFGSGSTEKRNSMVQIDKASKRIITIMDLTGLYLAMQSFGEISLDDFNIEGVVSAGDRWYFFQRGNGKNGKNAIFTVQGKNLENDFTILYNSYKLPKIKGVRLSFTDAIAVGNTLYFLASAENTESTYLDGDVLGSGIGSINMTTMKMGKTQIITDRYKFEGITLYSATNDQIEFLLCEDNDSDLLESGIYKLVIKNVN
ncbi:MAG TPA: hypothetical protein VFQ50_11040 [Flavobacterium sp.]|nr:hypothetical protein [Flavobacterium sp.]